MLMLKSRIVRRISLKYSSARSFDMQVAMQTGLGRALDPCVNGVWLSKLT